MAEGSYSFPSGYMIGGHGLLPAFPLRKACTHLAEPLDGLELLKGEHHPHLKQKMLAPSPLPALNCRQFTSQKRCIFVYKAEFWWFATENPWGWEYLWVLLNPAYEMKLIYGFGFVTAVSSAVDVFYNYTSKLECNDFRHAVNPGQQIVYQNWNHQYCTEIFQIWATDGGELSI